MPRRFSDKQSLISLVALPLAVLVVLLIGVVLLVQGCPSAIPNRPPVAVIKANPTSGTAPLDVHFDASASYDPDGTIQSYKWDFGDGETATGVQVEHTYGDDGEFTATLTVTDGEGASDTESVELIVSNPGPTASFTVSTTSPPVGEAVTFDASGSVDPAGLDVQAQDIVSYDWDFGDGDTASGRQVSHRYTKSGNYTVTLTVADDDGAKDTATKSLGAVAKIYWTDAGTRKVQRANLDGSDVEDLVIGVASEGIALDLINGRMYWVSARKIRRANLDGTNVELLVTLGSGSGTARGITLDVEAGKMYWTNWDKGKIQRANLNGTGVEDLITGLDAPLDVALDLAGGKVYWTNSEAGLDKIQRADLDGTSVEDLVTGLSAPVGIALDADGGKMYWADLGGKIQRANLDGTGVEDLIPGLDRPRGITLDLKEGKVYWTDWGTDKIQRANLDGTNVEDLLSSGLSHPRGIALTP